MLEISEIKEKVTFEEAKEYAKSLGEGWRVPWKYELMMIQSYKHIDNTHTSKWYKFFQVNTFWAEEFINVPETHAWVVNPDYGRVYTENKNTYQNVRCIKGTTEDLVRYLFEDVLNGKVQPTNYNK
jgi:hypothetical protein